MYDMGEGLDKDGESKTPGMFVNILRVSSNS